MVIFHCYVSSPEGNYSRGITASCCFPAERPYGPDLFDGCGVLQQWRNTLAHKYPLVTNGLNMILHDPIYSNLRWCTPVYIYIYIFFVYYVIYKQQSTCATRFHCPRTSGASIGVLTQKSFFFLKSGSSQLGEPVKRKSWSIDIGSHLVEMQSDISYMFIKSTWSRNDPSEFIRIP